MRLISYHTYVKRFFFFFNKSESYSSTRTPWKIANVRPFRRNIITTFPAYNIFVKSDENYLLPSGRGGEEKKIASTVGDSGAVRVIVR